MQTEFLTRRSHKKSRTGCGHCKSRRVKCDEKKPSCTNCSRRKLDCDFAKAHRSLRGTSSESYFNSRELLQLELLHHFTTETVATLHFEANSKEALSKPAVKLAFSHPFLLHGILALAALHISHFKVSTAASDTGRQAELVAFQREASEYARVAAEQHTLSLAGFREAMKDINKSNCHALFAFSSILVCFSIAQSGNLPLNPSSSSSTSPESSSTLEHSPHPSQAQSESQEDPPELAEWIALMPGTRCIIDVNRDWIREGPLKMLLNRNFMDNKVNLLPDIDIHLQELTTFCNISKDGEDVITIYAECNRILREAYRSTLANQACGLYHPNTILLWPAAVPYGYFGLLKSRKPEALALLATFSHLLHYLEHLWWAHGAATNIIVKIE